MRKFKASVPGKVFLIGEYLSLDGGPCVVATTRRRMRLSMSSLVQESDFWSPHPESPAGQLAECFGFSEFHSLVKTPSKEFSGLGSSTAEFILLNAFLEYLNHEAPRMGAFDIWDSYREILSRKNRTPLPSGADVIAQALGGVVRVETRIRKAEKIRSDVFENFVVFSAAHLGARKTATHEHLKTLRMPPGECLKKLESICVAFATSLQTRDMKSAGRSMNAYADLLSELGLESSEAFEDRKLAESIDGVFGVKGSGARLSDSLVILTDSAAAQAKVKEIFLNRGLRETELEITDGRGLEIEVELKTEQLRTEKYSENVSSAS